MGFRLSLATRHRRLSSERPNSCTLHAQIFFCFLLRAAGLLFRALTLKLPSFTVSILWTAHCLTGLTSSLAELIKSFKVREVGQISSEHLSPRCEPVPCRVCPPLAQDQWLH